MTSTKQWLGQSFRIYLNSIVRFGFGYISSEPFVLRAKDSHLLLTKVESIK
jgi:hypothetical protein